MNENQLSRVMGRLAEELAPGDVDLWPAIQKRFETSKQYSQQGDLSMNTKLARNRWVRLAGAVILIMLAISALLFATPQGRVWAQEALRFFTREKTDTLPVLAKPMTPTPSLEAASGAPSEMPTPDPGSILDAKMTVKEVEALAGYTVRKPGSLAGDLSFVGASYETHHHIARIFYQDGLSNSLALREEPFQQTEDCALCGTIGASAQVEMVSIGDAAGEYVVGVWKLTDKGSVWESDPFLQRLRWQANGMAYELTYMGQPDYVTKEDLIAIAASVR